MVTLLTILVFPTLGNCSMATDDVPSFLELAEQADLILIGKVINVEVREKDTITVFQVSEYIKEKNMSPEFTLKLAGGTNRVTRPSSPTFDLDEEYLLFLMDENLINLMNDDKFYSLLFDHYGKLRMNDMDVESLNNIRELYGVTYVRPFSTMVTRGVAGVLITVLIAFILYSRRQIN